MRLTLSFRFYHSCSHIEVSLSLSLASNTIEGSVPAGIGKLQHLQVLDLHDNNLTGDLEDDFCSRDYVSLVTDCLGKESGIKSCSCCSLCCDDVVCCGEYECSVIHGFQTVY